MARESPVEFKMYFKIHFETVIRGHHVYKHTWTPVLDEVLECEEDTRAEAKEYDSNSIGVYHKMKQPTNEKKKEKKTCWACASRTLVFTYEISCG